MAFSRSKGSGRLHGGRRMPDLAANRDVELGHGGGHATAAEGAKQADAGAPALEAEVFRFVSSLSDQVRAPASQPAPHMVRPRRRLLTLKRRREAGATGRGDSVDMQEVLHSARERLEALEGNGGVEGMNLEELDGLGSSGMAMLQLAEKGKESARKREQAALSQEREARRARDAAAVAELRRLEEENAELRETLASERKAAVRLQYELLELESEKKALRDELDSQGHEMMALFSDKEFLREEVVSQGNEIVELDSDKQALQSELVCQRHEIMELKSEMLKLREKLEAEKETLREKLEAEKETLGEKLEAEKEKLTCQICYVRTRTTVILPCSHFQFCNSCVKQHRDRSRFCPTCRNPITGTMDLFVS